MPLAAEKRPGPRPVAVQIDTGDPALKALAEITRARLGGQLAAEGGWALRFADDRVELLGPGDAPGTGVAAASRRAAGVRRRQPLGRALGPPPGPVVDATGGTGDDAGLMRAMGYEVTIMERSPVAHALLAGAGILGRLASRVVFGDARELLPQMNPPPRVIYLDPMFPPRRRSSALSRKAPRYLAETVGTDPDAGQLLAVARATAVDRVVVKRPDHAPPLAEDVRARVSGKLVHYDVYEPTGTRRR